MKIASHAPQFMGSYSIKAPEADMDEGIWKLNKNREKDFWLISVWSYYLENIVIWLQLFLQVLSFQASALKSVEEKRLEMKMNGAIIRSLRESFEKEKITTSVVCGLFVKVTELSSISWNLGENKIYVREEMCFKALLLFTIYFADP